MHASLAACRLLSSLPHYSESSFLWRHSTDTTSAMSRFLHACDIAISDFALSRDFRNRISDFPFFISSSSSMMRYRSSKISNLSSKIFKIEDRCSILIAISTFQMRSLSPEKFKISKIFKVFLYYLETLKQFCFRNFGCQIQNSNPKSGYRKMLNSRSDFLKLLFF